MITIKKRKNAWKIYTGAYLIGKVVDNSIANRLDIYHNNIINNPIVIETSRGDVTHVSHNEGVIYITTDKAEVVMIPVKEEDLQ